MSGAPPAHFVASEHLAVARHIVRTDFSEQVETLCSFLLCNGPSSLKDIVDSGYKLRFK